MPEPRTLPPILFVVALAAASTLGCDRKGKPDDAPPPPASVLPVPPALTATPVSAFADASVEPSSDAPPYDQAVAYHASGQLWLARLVLERQALAAGAPARETELLARLCSEQADEECIQKCEARLGKKIARDAGASRDVVPVKATPDEETDAAKAQRMVLQGDHEGARLLLLPKLVDKKIDAGELRVLRAACEHQRDTMCVLACDGYKKQK